MSSIGSSPSRLTLGVPAAATQDDHAQTVRYTVYMDDKDWRGKGKTITVMGTGSSVQGGDDVIAL